MKTIGCLNMRGKDGSVKRQIQVPHKRQEFGPRG